MNYQKTFELYEKFYFHEVEAREKISARLQIPLAILLSITSVYAYLAKGISLESSEGWLFLFYVLIFLSATLYLVSAVFFIRSFYGHTYEFLPSASETEKYRQKLISTYSEYEDSDLLVSKYFDEYLFKYYNECSSVNTTVNDNRSTFLHKCNTFSILNVFPLMLAFLVFTFFGLDKNSKDREYKVDLVNPISLELSKTPIKIDANLSSTTLEITISNDLKEMIRERQTETTATSTTPSTPAEEGAQRGRTNAE